MAWGNGLHLSRTYDQDYRLTFQQTGETFTTYGYDPNGNLSFIGKGPSESSEYQYDPLDRLIVEADRDVRKAYSYDGNGNRLARTTTFSIEPPRDDEFQALEIASNSNRVSKLNGVTVERDAAGNTLRQRDGIRYTYDAQGRLKQVFDGSELIADYRYNSLGQRTVKQAYAGGSVVTTWTYLYGQAGELLGYSQYGAAGNKVKSQYIVWLGRMPLAALDIAYSSDGVSISSLKKLYLHSDHLNTPRLATNDAQVPQWRWDSDAFGVGMPNQDVDGDGVAVDIALRFPGQLYDEHSRLYYNYFRDYDPNTGRYVESDPIGLNGGLNTYGYVFGNPANLTDPNGLAPCPPGTVPPGTACYMSDPSGQTGYPNEGRCATAECAANMPRQNDMRAPDFVNFQVDACMVSAWGTFSRDGNSYAGFGFNRTYPSALNFSGSVSAGWLNRAYVRDGDVNNFLNGYAANGTKAYYYVGGGLVSSPGNGTATLVGVGAGASKGASSNTGGNLGAGNSYNQGSTGVRW